MLFRRQKTLMTPLMLVIVLMVIMKILIHCDTKHIAVVQASLMIMTVVAIMIMTQVMMSDHFSEVDHLQLSGNLESLLDGDISSEHLLTFAPGEGQQPLGFFQDKDSEYLAFPTIYCGQRHLDNKDRVTKVHYSDINTIVHITSVLYPSQRSTLATINHQLQPS